MYRFLFLGAVCVGLLPSSVGFAQPSPGDVVINEILYAPSPSTNEFIELYNRSADPVDLSQLEVADEQQDYSPIAQTSTELAPDEYVVLARDTDAFESAFPSVEYRTPPGWDALNNGGDTVYLHHSSSATVLDSVPYAPSWGGSNGQSLERIDPGGSSTRAHNFATSDAAAGATPNAQNSIYAPDETAPTLESVTPSPDGDSLTARFSEPLDASTVTISNFHLEGGDAPSVVGAAISESHPQQVQCALATSLPPGSHTLVATHVADHRGNVQVDTEASFSFFDAPVPRAGDIVISELMYAPSVASNEFIELYNRSGETFDLGSLQIADDNRDFASIAPPFTPFEPGTYVVLVRNPEAFKSTYPETDYHVPEEWPALNNGGDTPFLRHAASEVLIDSVPYTSSWGGTPGTSLERIDPRGPSDTPNNFAPSTAPLGATPGAENSRHAPDATPPIPVFAEQVGADRGRVSFDEPLTPSSIEATAFALEGTSVTDAHLKADTLVHLSLSEPPSTSSLTVGGVRDRVGNAVADTTLPFARRPDSTDLIVNEVLFDPLADDFDDRPNQVEYVELLNRTDHPLTLNGMTLTDRPTEEGQADTLKMGQPRAVAPNGFVVIAAAPDGASELPGSSLAEAFPDAPLSADRASVLLVPGVRLGLDNDGDLVRVHSADGSVITETTYDPDWHTSALADPKGTALERISPTTTADVEDNWTSSTAPAGGTPGISNSVALEASSPAPEEPGLRIEPSPFSIERDGATRIQYTLSAVPNLVRVRIFDARGRKVRTLEQAHLAGRTGELVWNGRNDAGHRVRIGVYVVLFEAVRAETGTVRRFKETVVLARPLD